MRTILALAASGLSVLALAVSLATGGDDIAPFFAVLAVAAAVIAWLVRPGDHSVWAGRSARGLAVLWVGAAVWIAVLLVMFRTMCGCSYAEPVAPPPNVAGIPATVFHLAATYLGGAFVVVAAFSRRLAGPRDEAPEGDRR